MPSHTAALMNMWWWDWVTSVLQSIQRNGHPLGLTTCVFAQTPWQVSYIKWENSEKSIVLLNLIWFIVLEKQELHISLNVFKIDYEKNRLKTLIGLKQMEKLPICSHKLMRGEEWKNVLPRNIFLILFLTFQNSKFKTVQIAKHTARFLC